MARIHQCELREVRNLNERYCHLRIGAPELAAVAEPGQFVNLQVSDAGSVDPLLKRPFSIHRVNRAAGEIEVLVKVVGRGTKRLWDLGVGGKQGAEGVQDTQVLQSAEGTQNAQSVQKPEKAQAINEGAQSQNLVWVQNYSKSIEVIGPLGQGFQLQENGRALLVGGGIGVAPLKELASSLTERGVEVTLLLGLTDVADLPLVAEVGEFGPEVILVNPGESGYRQGLVTELVTERLETGRFEQIYTCGPEPMLAAMQRLLSGRLADLQISMEEKMGCGIGLCFSCTCKVKREADPAKGLDDWNYERVCTRGPIFRGDEVIFHG